MEILNSLSDDIYLSAKLKSMSGGDIIEIRPYDDAVKLYFLQLSYTDYCFDNNGPLYKPMYLNPVHVKMSIDSIKDTLLKLEDEKGPLFHIKKYTNPFFYNLMVTKINRTKIWWYDDPSVKNVTYTIKGNRIYCNSTEIGIDPNIVENVMELVDHLVSRGYKCEAYRHLYVLKRDSENISNI